jgi:hypothetical protein
LGSANGAAQECAAPASAGPELTKLAGAERLRFIRKTLQDTARAEKRFALGWSLTYTGLAAGAWVFLPLSPSDQGQLIESAWNSGTAGFAALYVLFDPLLTAHDSRRLERLLAGADASGNPCQVLAEAEALLAHAADKETSARGALAHIGNFAFNVGLGLILGYGLHRPAGAAMNTTIGVTLGELMILTRPQLASQSLARYRKGELTAPPSGAAVSWSVTPIASGAHYGLALAGSF